MLVSMMTLLSNVLSASLCLDSQLVAKTQSKPCLPGPHAEVGGVHCVGYGVQVEGTQYSAAGKCSQQRMVHACEAHYHS